MTLFDQMHCLSKKLLYKMGKGKPEKSYYFIDPTTKKGGLGKEKDFFIFIFLFQIDNNTYFFTLTILRSCSLF